MFFAIISPMKKHEKIDILFEDEYGSASRT